MTFNKMGIYTVWIEPLKNITDYLTRLPPVFTACRCIQMPLSDFTQTNIEKIIQPFSTILTRNLKSRKFQVKKVFDAKTKTK